MKKYFLFSTALIILILFIDSCKKEKNTENDVRVDWMTELREEYPDKKILFSDICMPGSHDAGMYILRSCLIGANTCNTQTQELNLYQQLEAGYRVFDIRPVKKGEMYYVQHTTDCGGLGCQGDYLDYIFNYTNQFLEKYNEVIIFEVSHICGFDTKEDTVAFFNMAKKILGDKIYTETEYESNFYDWSLEKILGENPKHGKIILMFEDNWSNNIEMRQQGYFSENIMHLEGGWSNKNEYGALKTDQLAKFKNYQPESPKIFQFSYQMTQDAMMAVACGITGNAKSIRQLAQESNTDFPLVIDDLIQTGEINSGKIPNIFWCDFGDKWMIEVAKKVSKVRLQD